MKISELAHYRELLESLRPKSSDITIRSEMDPVIDQIDRHPSQMPRYLELLRLHRAQAVDSIESFDHTLDDLLDELLNRIKALEPSYLAKSYQLYEQTRDRDSADYVLDRRFPITEDNRTYVQSRIQSHSDYHYAGMILRPGKEDWIDQMVACDPLYLVDTHHDMFAPVKERFNPIYQGRLRYYVVQEDRDDPIMSMLPDGQIGFCLAYNFFHYKPFEIMRAYIREIYDKIAPGGILAMTFNDCDRRGAVELAERSFCCYTPGRMILAALEAQGFGVEQNYRLDAAVNWIELRKPGRMHSIRGGQTLAKIVAKSK